MNEEQDLGRLAAGAGQVDVQAAGAKSAQAESPLVRATAMVQEQNGLLNRITGQYRERMDQAVGMVPDLPCGEDSKEKESDGSDLGVLFEAIDDLGRQVRYLQEQTNRLPALTGG